MAWHAVRFIPAVTIHHVTVETDGTQHTKFRRTRDLDKLHPILLCSSKPALSAPVERVVLLQRFFVGALVCV